MPTMKLIDSILAIKLYFYSALKVANMDVVIKSNKYYSNMANELNWLYLEVR